MLGFLHGMILLGAVGAMLLINLAPNALMRTIVSLLLVAASVHLACQGYLANYRYYADPANPYVYAHTSNDIFAITRRVKEIAQVHPDGHSMPSQIICPNADYWPLPWYLRSFRNVRWGNKVDEDVPAAPVIITSPSMKPALIRYLYELPPSGKKNLYVPLFESHMELRPQVELLGFVTKDLWDNYRQHPAQSVQNSSAGEK